MTTDVEILEKPINIQVLMDKIKKLEPTETPLILVAEDDDLSRDLLLQAIHKIGWTALEAINGKEVLEQLEFNKPTVILLDIMMPEMDGFQVIEALHKNEDWRHIPVIVITAKELTREEQVLLAKYSETLFLKKSYSTRNLITAVIDRIKRENK
jgi:CheY-like chemotaxis protein